MPRSARLTATLALALSVVLTGAGQAYGHGDKGGSSQHGKDSGATTAAARHTGRHPVPEQERARPSSAHNHAGAKHGPTHPARHAGPAPAHATSTPRTASATSKGHPTNARTGGATSAARTTGAAAGTAKKPVVHANVTLIGSQGSSANTSSNKGKGHQTANGVLKGNGSKNGKGNSGTVTPASAGSTTPRSGSGGLTLGGPAPFAPAATKPAQAAQLPSRTSGAGSGAVSGSSFGSSGSTLQPTPSSTRSATPGNPGRNSAQEVPYAASGPPARRTMGLLVAVIVLFVAALGAMVMGAGYRGRATR